MEDRNQDIANCFLNLVRRYRDAFPTVSLGTILSLLNPHGEWAEAANYGFDNEVLAYCSSVAFDDANALAPYVAYLIQHPFAAYNMKWFCDTKAPREQAETIDTLVQLGPLGPLGPLEPINNNNNNAIDWGGDLADLFSG